MLDAKGINIENKEIELMHHAFMRIKYIVADLKKRARII